MSTFGKGQNPVFPRILRHEAAGIVKSVGEGLIELQPGDHVFPIFIGECKECAHCKSEESNMCDLLRINTDRGVMINDGKLRFSIKGLGATLNVAKPTKGSSVAILRLGAVGLSAVKGARIAGASRIIGVDLNPARLEEAKMFGVNEFVNAKDYDKPVQEVLQLQVFCREQTSFSIWMSTFQV